MASKKIIVIVIVVSVIGLAMFTSIGSVAFDRLGEAEAGPAEVEAGPAEKLAEAEAKLAEARRADAKLAEAEAKLAEARRAEAKLAEAEAKLAEAEAKLAEAEAKLAEADEKRMQATAKLNEANKKLAEAEKPTQEPADKAFIKPPKPDPTANNLYPGELREFMTLSIAITTPSNVSSQDAVDYFLKTNRGLGWSHGPEDPRPANADLSRFKDYLEGQGVSIGWAVTHETRNAYNGDENTLLSYGLCTWTALGLVEREVSTTEFLQYWPIECHFYTWDGVPFLQDIQYASGKGRVG